MNAVLADAHALIERCTQVNAPADICDAPSNAFFAAFPQSIAHRFDGSGGILPPFYAACATLRPTGPMRLLSQEMGLPDAFDGMLERLSAGETVQVALQLDRESVLTFAQEPRVLQFLALSEIDASLTIGGIPFGSEPPQIRASKLFVRGLEIARDLRLGPLSFPVGPDGGYRRQSAQAPISFEINLRKPLTFPASPGAPEVPISYAGGFPVPKFERLRLEHNFSDV